jgi:hypothetical protein
MDENKFFNKFHSKYIRECSNIIKNMYNQKRCTGLKDSLIIDESTYREVAKHNINNYLSESGALYIKLGYIKNNDRIDMLMNNISYKLNEGYYLYTEEDDNGSNIFLMSEYCIETEKEIVHKELLETTAMIKEIEESLTYVMDNSNNVLEKVSECIDVLDGQTIKALARFTMLNEFADNSILTNIIKESMGDIPYSSMKDADKRDALDTLTYKWLPINDKANIYRLFTLKEGLKEIDEAFDSVHENALQNNLLIIREKIKKNAVGLSDKDKQYSHQVDTLVDRMSETVQKDLTNKNREAVIKGKLLPSASAIIKLAIASGVAAVVNPALGVITLLGGLAMAKIGTEKERQYILDEIEIEQKIVERKIQMADRNDDTKALEQLYRIEKQLKREEARIKYHKKDFVPVTRD